MSADSYQFESRLWYKDPRFGLYVCSTAGHTQIPAGIDKSTEFDIVYAAQDYLAQMRATHQLVQEHADFTLSLSAESVGLDESDRKMAFFAQLRSEADALILQPTADMTDYIDGIPTSEFPQAFAYVWGGFFSKVRELSPHDLDYEPRFAGLAAFHDGQTGRQWLQKARDGELCGDLSEIIAKAQKTFSEIAKGAAPQPPKNPER